MNGIVDIEIHNKRGIKYEFSLYRNVTIIRGESATGKTTLYRLISNYEDENEKSGVVIDCKYPLVTLSKRDWDTKLDKINNSIVFIDEGNKFIKSKNFATLVKKSTNYYVLITRENLENLPSSIEEIYEIKTKNKKHILEKIYKLNEKYILSKDIEKNNFNVFLTEDSKSGLQFFKKCFDKSTIKCETSNGNTKLYDYLLKFSKDKIFLFADGAALSPYIDEIYKYKIINKNKIVILCLPESFEYLLLKSGVLNKNEFKNELEKPYDFINYNLYLTWEQYFVYLIERVTKNKTDGSKYSKNKIAIFYTKKENIKKILKIIGL